jgi:hypothetical protein
MTLDPDAAAWLERMRTLGVKSYDELSLEEGRRLADDGAEALFGEPDPIEPSRMTLPKVCRFVSTVLLTPAPGAFVYFLAPEKPVSGGRRGCMGGTQWTATQFALLVVGGDSAGGHSELVVAADIAERLSVAERAFWRLRGRGRDRASRPPDPRVATTGRLAVESASRTKGSSCRPGFGSSSLSLLYWPSLATLAGDASLGSCHRGAAGDGPLRRASCQDDEPLPVRSPAAPGMSAGGGPNPAAQLKVEGASPFIHFTRSPC